MLLCRHCLAMPYRSCVLWPEDEMTFRMGCPTCPHLADGVRSYTYSLAYLSTLLLLAPLQRTPSTDLLHTFRQCPHIDAGCRGRHAQLPDCTSHPFFSFLLSSNAPAPLYFFAHPYPHSPPPYQCTASRSLLRSSRSHSLLPRLISPLMLP